MSWHNLTETETIPGKRKRSESDKNMPNSNSPLSIPNLPRLEPIEFVESEYPDTINTKNSALASFFDGESSRHVTNKPGM